MVPLQYGVRKGKLGKRLSLRHPPQRLKKNISKVLLLFISVLLASCLGTPEAPLRPLPTLKDRGDLAELGQAPLMLHPDGVEILVDGSLVQSDTGRPGFQFTFQIENRSAKSLDFPWRLFWSRTDHGPRKLARQALMWNPETEEYEKAPQRIPPGSRVLVVVRTGVEGTFNIYHLIRVTLHWKYKQGTKVFAAASRFRPD